MKYLFFSFAFVMIFSYCQPHLNLPFENDERKLVIWSFLHPDSIVTAYISSTRAPLSKDKESLINDASVVLYENDKAIDTLKEVENGIYKAKKEIKLKEKKIYQIKVNKEGYLAIETPKDTMPEKPIVFNYSAVDSIRKEQGHNIALITLNTNNTSHYKNYGFGNFKAIGLPFSEINVYENGRSTCDNNGFFDLYGYSFIHYNCKLSNNIYNLFVDNYYPKGFKNAKIKFTICSITFLNIAYNEKVDLLASHFSDYYSGVDLFWNPVYLPNYIKNGYGFFGCYNTSDIEISF
jgi:hypothetical protein